MLPKKYHAIVFFGVLVMLLLLGLHLLGIGYSSGQSTATKTAALARNSSQTSSSSNIDGILGSNQAYRHPIVYDKLTGATNNQINDVLGAKQSTTSDYPIDHYQQQQQQQQQQHQLQQAFNPLAQDDFLFNIHRQQQQSPGFPPPGHPLSRHMHPHHLNAMPPPPPPPMMTTQTPSIQQQLGIPMQPLPPPPPPVPPNNNGNNNQRQSLTNDDSRRPQLDSIPSASSLNNNTSTSTSQQQHQSALTNGPQQQQQSPVYYTPPIFAYNNFDQNRPLNDLQLGNMINPYMSYASQPITQQQPHMRAGIHSPAASMNVPEAPLTIDEYNARQTRMRQNLQQQSPLVLNGGEQNKDRYNSINHLSPPQRLSANSIVEPQFSTTQQFNNSLSNNQSQNLLGNPQQQQLHRQQMLDKKLLFASNPYHLQTELNNNNLNLTNNYYPDPALYRVAPVSGPPIRAPYAQAILHQQPESNNIKQQQVAQNRNFHPPPTPATNQRIEPQQTHLPLKQQLIKSNNPNQLNHLITSQQSQALQETPACATKQAQEHSNFIDLELANSTSQLPILYCNEDLDYPTKDIMQALETYALDRPIEQLLPQPLTQIYLSSQPTKSSNAQQQLTGTTINGIHQQLTLDTLQPSINIFKQQQLKHSASHDSQLNGQLVSFDDQRSFTDTPTSGQLNNLFPSANYESLCKSNIFMAQPRRVKNLIGQWKIIVNLPGHKYRGTAISQMIRIEECTRPNGECSLQSTPSRSSSFQLQQIPKSRCLQHYENQRLVAWSHQQGLHLDIFRVPTSCSCHIRR